MGAPGRFLTRSFQNGRLGAHLKRRASLYGGVDRCGWTPLILPSPGKSRRFNEHSKKGFLHMSEPNESTTSESSSDLAVPDTALMDQLVSGTLGPLSRLRDTIDLTLDEVSDWIMQPYNRQQISNLVTVLDAQTQLIICQQRLVAAARLAEVAATAQAPETVRRACADLLKIRLIDPYREDKRPEKMPPPPVYSESQILASLERLGSMDGESPSPHQPDLPPDPPPSFDELNLDNPKEISKTASQARKS